MSGNHYEIRVVKKCPVCGWRIFDKITPTSGLIEMKCPGCRKVITVDLSFRIPRRRSGPCGHVRPGRIR